MDLKGIPQKGLPQILARIKKSGGKKPEHLEKEIKSQEIGKKPGTVQRERKFHWTVRLLSAKKGKLEKRLETFGRVGIEIKG